MISIIRNSVFIKPLCFISAFTMLFLTSSFSAPKKITIKAGTPVSLQLNSPLSSGNCTQGQMIDFRVMYDVKTDGQVVIPAGTNAKGQVVSCQPAKGMGKPGAISIQVKTLAAPDGTMIYLSSSTNQYKGVNRSALAWIAGGALFLTTCIGGIVVFIIKGGEAETQSGISIDANVSTDTEITIN